MKFERKKDPKATMGIGEFGKRGLRYDDPWIMGVYNNYHVKTMAWAIDGFYRENAINISIFNFPANDGDHPHPQFVITALPGEKTDYNSIYRKISYPEIISLFFKLEEDSEFRNWMWMSHPTFSKFLKIKYNEV